jgi:hypothetical protein
MWLLIGRLLAALGVGTIGGWIGSHVHHPDSPPNLAGFGSSDGGGLLGAAPLGPSGLQQGANDAAAAYQQALGTVSATNGKVLQQVADIFGGNDQLRTKVQGILTDLAAKHQALIAGHPGDPAATRTYLDYVDQKLTEVQQLLDSHKVDSQKQADLLKELAHDYKQVGGANPGGGGQGGGQPGGSGGTQPGQPGGAGAPGGSAGGTPPGGPGGLVDPLAGLGGPGAEMAGMLPGLLSTLGSAPAGLGGLGGAPLDALSALPALATLGARGPEDPSANGHGDEHGKGGEPGDEGGGKGGGEQPGGKPGQQPGQQPGTPGAAPAVNTIPGGTPAGAAPVVAATPDAGRVVQMPDGTPVTTPSTQKADAMKGLLAGHGVTESYKGAGIPLPPAGTPITTPVDPSQLTPGMAAGYKSREAIPYMGADKIWLDGQLQPKSALPAGDFMGWFDPQTAANAPAAAPAAVRSPAPPATGS